MLKKMAVDKGKDWDKLLPYLLLAYREVSQAASHLLSCCESVVSYVLGVREKLSTLSKLPQENVANAQ